MEILRGMHLVIMGERRQRSKEHLLFRFRQTQGDQFSCDRVLCSIQQHGTAAMLQVHRHVFHAFQQLNQTLPSHLRATMDVIFLDCLDCIQFLKSRHVHKRQFVLLPELSALFLQDQS